MQTIMKQMFHCRQRERELFAGF